MKRLESLLVGGVFFMRSAVGVITKPYETYRNIINRSDFYELIPVFVICSVYFALASIVRTAAFRPFILTREFLVLSLASAATYLGLSYLIYFLSSIFKGRGELKNILVGWGYTLLPTVVWFFMTSILYLLLPPPRTLRWQGILYSAIFLTATSVLLFWKLTLSYLTVRFAMRLDLLKIIGIILILCPIIGIYSLFMYRLGIFRVPFI